MKKIPTKNQHSAKKTPNLPVEIKKILHLTLQHIHTGH